MISISRYYLYFSLFFQKGGKDEAWLYVEGLNTTSSSPQRMAPIMSWLHLPHYFLAIMDVFWLICFCWMKVYSFAFHFVQETFINIYWLYFWRVFSFWRQYLGVRCILYAGYSLHILNKFFNFVRLVSHNLWR